MQEAETDSCTYSASKSSVEQTTCNQSSNQIEFRLPPIRVPSRKEREVWSVKALPSDWDPVSKPSQIVDNLNAKRKQRHESIQNEVIKRCREINLDLEMQIRLISQLFKQELHRNNHTISEIIDKIENEPDKPDKFEMGYHDFIKAELQNSYENNKRALEEFYLHLQDIEKKRSKRYKEVLKYEYLELFNISYHSPYELQSYFEHKLLNFNQMILNNFRYYLDIRLNLHNRLTSTFNLQNQKISKIYLSWRCQRRTSAIIKLNKTKLLESGFDYETLNTEQAKQASNVLLNQQQIMSDMLSHESDFPICSTDGKRWTNKIQETLNALDTSAKKLISFYKVAVVHVFNGYFEELTDICEQMADVYDSDNCDEINMLSMELCKPSIESITKRCSTTLYNLEVQWTQVINNLQKNLQITYAFLRLASGIWDKHFDRVEEIKIAILKEVNEQIEANDRWQNGYEMELTTVLDTLRQASSEIKLQTALNDVYKKLDILGDNYKAHYNTEVQIVEKFDNLIQVEADLLRAELGQILNQFPKGSRTKKRDNSFDAATATAEQTEDNGNQNEKNTNHTFADLLLQHMKQCEYQVGAVQNWMYGLQEGIEVYRISCKDDSRNQASAWINDAKKKLGKRMEVKLEIHKTKHERIKCGIYEVRLAELKIHSEILSSHIKGAEEEIMDITKFFADLEDHCKIMISEFKKNVDTLKLKTIQASSSNEAKFLIQNLNYCSRNCQTELKSLMTPLDIMYNEKLIKIKQSSVKFARKIRLFSEDGNYHSDEVKQVTNGLKKLEKTAKAKLKTVKKGIQAKQKKIFAQVKAEQAKILPLYNQMNELQFSDINMIIIQNLQVDLKKETFNLKFFIKKAEDNLEHLASFKNNMFDMANLKEFENCFQKLGKDLLELSNYLYQSEPINNRNNHKHKQVHNIDYSVFPVQKTEKTKQKRSKGLTSIERFDYSATLFENEPEGNCFMSKLCKYLQESLNGIQQEAKEFYDKHVKIINNKKVKPSYDKLMIGTLERFNFYHQQCELLWLNTVNEFLQFFNFIRTLLLEISSIFLKNHHKFNMDKLQESFKKLQKETEDIKNIEAVRNIRKKLKPLYGYDDNRHMLYAIQDEMNNAISAIRNFNIREELFIPFQEHQENCLNLYTDEYEAMNTIFKHLNDEYLVELVKSPLICQFETKISYLNEFVNNESDKETPDLSKTGTNVASAPRLGNFKIPSEFETTVEKIKLLQIENDEEKVSRKSDSYIEVYINEHNQYLYNVEEIESTWLCDIENEENIFRNDIEKICQLYSIKYTNSEN